MSILAEYRWYFLIGAEIVFWLAAIGFFYSVTDFV